MKNFLQVFVLTLFAGCVNFSRISEMPDVLALSLVHGELLVECPQGEDHVLLYDDGSIRVGLCKESSVACAEIQTSSKACQLTDAITACLRRGVKKLALFWRGSDCVVNDDMTLEPCAMPLCPAVKLDSFSGTLISINVVRGNCIFVNGKRMSSEKDLISYLRTVKCLDPNAEVVIRPDRKSHVSSLLRIVNACTSNGFWNLFLEGKNDEGASTIYPINIPCPNVYRDSEGHDSSCYIEKDTGTVQNILHFDLPDDGLALPLDCDASYTNADVIVYMISAEQDSSAPNEKVAYPCQKEFLDDYMGNNYKLRTDYILVIDNYSPYPYVFSAQYQASGYESLELDFLTSDNRILTAKKRVPKILSDTPRENVLNPNWRWKSLISLDIRLWKKPENFSADKVTHFRPRFAYGAFFVNGKYYRTITEIEAHRRKERPFKSREGELVGKWIPFQSKQQCWRSWK